MIKDVQGQIDTIKYDYRSLPLEIKKAGTSTYYRYNAEGQRVFKQTGTGISTYYIADAGGRMLAVVKSNTGYPVFNLWGNDHIGQLQVGYGASGSIVVQGLETPLVVQPRSDTRYYFLKDHLGSVRVTVDVSGNVTSYDDFYPFGMTMDGRSGNIGSGDARYKYTTKERDAESGYDYFGARYYDARIGRWMAVDPLAEKYQGYSPYVYSMNQPTSSFDADGRFVISAVVGNGVRYYEVSRIDWSRAAALQWLGVSSLLSKTVLQDPVLGNYHSDEWLKTGVEAVMNIVIPASKPFTEALDRVESGVEWPDILAAIRIEEQVFTELKDEEVLVDVAYVHADNYIGVEPVKTDVQKTLNPAVQNEWISNGLDPWEELHALFAKKWKEKNSKLYEKFYHDAPFETMLRERAKWRMGQLRAVGSYDASSAAPPDPPVNGSYGQ
jgi:RHS repeat-associated protein